jgi:NAD(P)-dependent dehydrogenase (short-subunit alcohol dehydrogenase family)
MKEPQMPERAAIVTGASSGIGLAIAQMLGEQGYALTMAARRADKLESAAQGLRDQGFDVLALAGSLADEAKIKGVADAHRRRFGRLDVLVNNAGIAGSMAVDDIDTSDLDDQLAVNVRSLILLTREALAMLREAGGQHRNALIVNTASIAGKRGESANATYSASKGAVLAFTRALHEELSTEGIKATALCPAFVNTQMTDRHKDRVPAEEMIAPSDIAEAVRMLLVLSPACIVPEMTFLRPGD